MHNGFPFLFPLQHLVGRRQRLGTRYDAFVGDPAARVAGIVAHQVAGDPRRPRAPTTDLARLAERAQPRPLCDVVRVGDPVHERLRERTDEVVLGEERFGRGVRGRSRHGCRDD